MENLIARRGMRQLIKFSVVGISSTIIDWLIYFLITRFLGIFYIFAKIISFLMAVINSYTWNRKWTFRSENPQKAQEFVKFLVVSVVGLTLNTAVMFLAVSKAHWHDLYALILATSVVMAWNFTIDKMWVFNRK